MSGMTREEAIKILRSKIRTDSFDESFEEIMMDCALTMAIADMEKQIPKAVINQDEFYDYAECPNCKSPARDFLGCIYGWCRNCGQRLKVGEEND